MDQRKSAVQRQFHRTGHGYRDSAIHAAGEDLTWVAEEAGTPLLALDVATGTGHTAFALSRKAGRVVGLDLTSRMLEIAAEEARRRGIINVTWFRGDAEAIPFPDRLFDVVSCRIAAHHFPRPERAFSECCRVLVPGGKLILVDNLIPEEEGADRLINEAERLRDPSHHRVCSPEAWKQIIEAGGFVDVTLRRRWETPVDVEEWFRRADTPPDKRREVRRLPGGASPSLRRLFGYDPGADAPRLILRKGLWTAFRRV